MGHLSNGTHDIDALLNTPASGGKIIVSDGSGGFSWQSNTSHTHTASQVTDFNTAADARVAAANLGDLANVSIGSPASGQVLKYNGTAWVNGADGGGISDVVEDISPQLGGNLDLNNFTVGTANATDLTKLSQITATSAELNYAVGVTSGIQTQLNSKAASGHGHDIADTTGLQTALDGKISTSEKAAASGVATLDGSTKVPKAQLPDAALRHVLPYSKAGLMAVGAGAHRLYNDSGAAWTILAVRASLGTAPVGQSVIIDVHKNGTTIFTTQANRPTIAAAANTSGKVTAINVTNVADGEYLTVDIDQVGTTNVGADLTVQLEVV